MSKRPSRKTFQQRLDDMISTLRDEIISGHWETGKFLPSESELAKRFHLSNISVRKGLDVLVKEGLVEKISYVGNRVTMPTPDRKTVVRFGYHHTDTTEADIAFLLKEFQKRYPFVEIQPIEIPGNYNSFVVEYMDHDQLDVVMINNINFRYMIQKGLSSLFSEMEEQEDTYNFLFRGYREEGRLLAQPFMFSPLVLCYNRDHFLEAGLTEPDSSWTWDDLFECARQLAIENERFGFYFDLFARNRWSAFMLQSGETFADHLVSEPKPLLESDERPEQQEPRQEPEPPVQLAEHEESPAEAQLLKRYRLEGTKLLDSLDFCKKLLSMHGVFPVLLSATQDVEELFLQQKTSIIMTTYFALNHLVSATFPFDIAPLPQFKESRTVLVQIGLSINRKTRVKEASHLLVDFLTSYEAQLLLRQKTLSIPANKRAAEWNGKESIYRPSRYHMYRDIIPSYRYVSDLGLDARGIKIVQQEIKLYWSGLQNKEKLCQRLEMDLSNLHNFSGRHHG